MVNALTIDVEDYFHVSAFSSTVARSSWESRERRVVPNTRRLLDLLAEERVKATFFVLGWVAAREPALVREIAGAGHEVASHGFAHRLVYELDRRTFGADLARARAAIEDACGMPVVGYRAPSFSVVRGSQWALDVLAEQGYAYDASIYPIRHDRYGMPGAPRHPHLDRRPAGTLVEVPATTVAIGPVTLPAAGGGYFRLYLYAATRWAIRRVNVVDDQPAIVYLHPWEIDPRQPRLRAGVVSRFRHYVNLSRTEPRLRQLLRDFPFAPLADVLGRLGLLIPARGAA